MMCRRKADSDREQAEAAKAAAAAAEAAATAAADEAAAAAGASATAAAGPAAAQQAAAAPSQPLQKQLAGLRSSPVPEAKPAKAASSRQPVAAVDLTGPEPVTHSPGAWKHRPPGKDLGLGLGQTRDEAGFLQSQRQTILGQPLH